MIDPARTDTAPSADRSHPTPIAAIPNPISAEPKSVTRCSLKGPNVDTQSAPRIGKSSKNDSGAKKPQTPSATIAAPKTTSARRID